MLLVSNIRDHVCAWEESLVLELEACISCGGLLNEFSSVLLSPWLVMLRACVDEWWMELSGCCEYSAFSCQLYNTLILTKFGSDVDKINIAVHELKVFIHS